MTYTCPSEIEARFLDIERRRDCLIDLKYVQLKKLERKFKVQQERLYRAIGGFVFVVYFVLIYTAYRGLLIILIIDSHDKAVVPMLSLTFLREELEEAIGDESGNKIVDVFEICLTLIYLVFIAWIASRPAYRIY